VDERLAEGTELRATFPLKTAPAAQLIEHVRDRLGHDRRYAIDYRKAQRELGYAPSRDLATGLRETLDWYLSHRGWWQALLGRDYKAWVDKNYKRP
jgi:dTDP-glucose 4,6-dehydratase